MQAAQICFTDVDVLWGGVGVQLLVPLLQKVLLYTLDPISCRVRPGGIEYLG